jgi:hypothetical protein
LKAKFKYIVEKDKYLLKGYSIAKIKVLV